MWEDFVARDGGPLTFRLILQPVVATVIAIRAGVRDARQGGAPFFWGLLWDPAHRRFLLRQGWKDVGRLFVLAILMDVIYQLLVHRWDVYPGETLIIAIVLAIVPYLILRGLTNRVAAPTHPR
jgi:hypothetical protein